MNLGVQGLLAGLLRAPHGDRETHMPGGTQWNAEAQACLSAFSSSHIWVLQPFISDELDRTNACMRWLVAHGAEGETAGLNEEGRKSTEFSA